LPIEIKKGKRRPAGSGNGGTRRKNISKCRTFIKEVISRSGRGRIKRKILGPKEGRWQKKAIESCRVRIQANVKTLAKKKWEISSKALHAGKKGGLNQPQCQYFKEPKMDFNILKMQNRKHVAQRQNSI